METENVAGKKEPVKGGGVCIYCGWDGGENGLADEHIVPYSLGGNTELLGASCTDCGGITSYLDGYLANAIFGDLRVHMNLQSRSGHDDTLEATVETIEGQRIIDLAVPNHPFFLNMPIWRPPGFMIGKLISDDFGLPSKFTYWWVPPNLRDVIGLKEGDIGRIIDTSPPHNLRTFARGLAKIAYCQAVMKYGLDGYRPLATPDIILGRYPNIAYFIGSDPTQPTAPYPRGMQHFVGLGDVRYNGIKLLTATIRLFGDSGYEQRGMPFYTVICGAEGTRKVIPKRRSPRYGQKILL